MPSSPRTASDAAELERSRLQFEKMTQTPVPKLILGLAAPTILSMLITSIYNLADTFFVGQLSTSASGAVGVVSSLMAIIQALGFMLGHGAGGIISRSLGSQDTHAATKFASTSFFTALTFGAVLAVLGLAALPDFMMLLGSTDTILPHACAYARPILIAAPLMMSSLVMNNILRYEGKASGTDVLDIDLDGVQAQYIRIRNLVQRGSWGKFSEFTVTEVLNQSGSTENLYTNVTTDIRSNISEGQVNLTNGTATLNTGDYVGVDLGNIKAVTGVTTSELPQGVTLETSMNGVTWTAYTAKSATDARYVRAVSSADGVVLNLTEFVVSYEFVGDKSVESNFAIQDTSSDMRNNGTVKNVFDGDLSTLGMITGTQDVGKTITFDLGQTIHFSSLRYYIVETQLNYPRHVKFEVSANGEDWTEVLVIGDGDFENVWDLSLIHISEPTRH